CFKSGWLPFESWFPATIELRIVRGPESLTRPPPSPLVPVTELLVIVLLTTVAEPKAKKPPPKYRAALPEMVLLVTVIEPAKEPAKMPPPLPVVELPEIVLLVIVTEPAKMPPPFCEEL